VCGGGGGGHGGGSAAGCEEGLHSAAARGYFEVWLGWVGLGWVGAWTVGGGGKPEAEARSERRKREHRAARACRS
jgi:hypothetical protein